MNTSQPSTILIVDDEFRADLYKMWLRGSYDIRTASSQEEAFSAVDESVVVCLLRRELHESFKDELTEQLQSVAPACKVGITTSERSEIVFPDVEHDLSLCEPITEDKLVDLVQTLTRRAFYHDLLRKNHQVKGKRRRVQNESGTDDGAATNALQERYDWIEEQLRTLNDRLDEEDITAVRESLKAQPFPTNDATDNDDDVEVAVRKHRPDSCPNCELTWGVKHDSVLGIGYTKLGSYTWKCTHCTEVHNKPPAHNRRVASR